MKALRRPNRRQCISARPNGSFPTLLHSEQAPTRSSSTSRRSSNNNSSRRRAAAAGTARRSSSSSGTPQPSTPSLMQQLSKLNCIVHCKESSTSALSSASNNNHHRHHPAKQRYHEQNDDHLDDTQDCTAIEEETDGGHNTIATGDDSSILFDVVEQDLFFNIDSSSTSSPTRKMKKNQSNRVGGLDLLLPSSPSDEDYYSKYYFFNDVHDHDNNKSSNSKRDKMGGDDADNNNDADSSSYYTDQSSETSGLPPSESSSPRKPCDRHKIQQIADIKEEGAEDDDDKALTDEEEEVEDDDEKRIGIRPFQVPANCDDGGGDDDDAGEHFQFFDDPLDSIIRTEDEDTITLEEEERVKNDNNGDDDEIRAKRTSATQNSFAFLKNRRPTTSTTSATAASASKNRSIQAVSHDEGEDREVPPSLSPRLSYRDDGMAKSPLLEVVDIKHRSHEDTDEKSIESAFFHQDDDELTDERQYNLENDDVSGDHHPPPPLHRSFSSAHDSSSRYGDQGNSDNDDNPANLPPLVLRRRDLPRDLVSDVGDEKDVPVTRTDTSGEQSLRSVSMEREGSYEDGKDQDGGRGGDSVTAPLPSLNSLVTVSTSPSDEYSHQHKQHSKSVQDVRKKLENMNLERSIPNSAQRARTSPDRVSDNLVVVKSSGSEDSRSKEHLPQDAMVAAEDHDPQESPSRATNNMESAKPLLSSCFTPTSSVLAVETTFVAQKPRRTSTPLPPLTVRAMAMPPPPPPRLSRPPPSPPSYSSQPPIPAVSTVSSTTSSSSSKLTALINKFENTTAAMPPPTKGPRSRQLGGAAVTRVPTAVPRTTTTVPQDAVSRLSTSSKSGTNVESFPRSVRKVPSLGSGTSNSGGKGIAVGTYSAHPSSKKLVSDRLIAKKSVVNHHDQHNQSPDRPGSRNTSETSGSPAPPSSFSSKRDTPIDSTPPHSFFWRSHPEPSPNSSSSYLATDSRVKTATITATALASTREGTALDITRDATARVGAPVGQERKAGTKLDDFEEMLEKKREIARRQFEAENKPPWAR